MDLRKHYSNRARQHTFNALAVHEKENHQGQPCLSNRIGFIAWLCHCIGIKPENLAQVAAELEIYNRECQDKSCFSHIAFGQKGICRRCYADLQKDRNGRFHGGRSAV